MVGNVKVGGAAPIAVQSMTNTFTHDIAATISQIKRLEKAGCEIARVAVPDQEVLRAQILQFRDALDQEMTQRVTEKHRETEHTLMLLRRSHPVPWWTDGDKTSTNAVRRW